MSFEEHMSPEEWEIWKNPPKDERLKCDRCGLHPPTIRKILRRIVHTGNNQVDIMYEQVCTICAPVSLRVEPSQPA